MPDTVERTLQSMSVEQKLGQLFCIEVNSSTLNSAFKETIAKYHFGNVGLFNTFNGSRRQIRQSNLEIEQVIREHCAGVQPIIAVDEEGGCSSQFQDGVTPTPGNFALGATDDENDAYSCGWSIGSELCDLGINMAWAPVLDLCRNPHDPIVGARSFGDSPQLVARLGIALSKGLNAGGVGSTYKHYPGQGSISSSGDSYRELPVSRLQEHQLNSLDGYPFLEAIRQGADCLMVGNVVLSGIPKVEKGVPATLSRYAMTTLLRERYGYDGVVVTDNIGLGPTHDAFPPQKAALLAFRAGADMITALGPRSPHIVMYNALLSALKQKAISEEAMNDRVRRILRLKERLSAYREARRPLSELQRSLLLRKVARDSVTLVRDPRGLLPARPEQFPRVLVIVPQMQAISSADGFAHVECNFGDIISPFYPVVTVQKIPLAPDENRVGECLQLAGKHDLVMICSENANEFPLYLNLVNQISAVSPTIVIPLRFAYEITALHPSATIVSAFSYMDTSLRAVGDVIRGEAQPPGKLPIHL
ncbi:MAG TPA: glycoside hydrolase family 3 protein [Firmicutes bacterium]|nr:glycoside hydrolase family 3 protein [Bacillota bacterium]